MSRHLLQPEEDLPQAGRLVLGLPDRSHLLQRSHPTSAPARRTTPRSSGLNAADDRPGLMSSYTKMSISKSTSPPNRPRSIEAKFMAASLHKGAATLTRQK